MARRTLQEHHELRSQVLGGRLPAGTDIRNESRGLPAGPNEPDASEVETSSDDSSSSGGTSDPEEAPMSDPGQAIDIEPEVLSPAWSNLSQPSLRPALSNEMLDDTMRLRRPRFSTSSSAPTSPSGPDRPARYSPYPLAPVPEETYHLSDKFFDLLTDTRNYTNLATEIAFNVGFSEVQDGIDLDRLVESCFVVSAARINVASRFVCAT